MEALRFSKNVLWDTTRVYLRWPYVKNMPQAVKSILLLDAHEFWIWYLHKELDEIEKWLDKNSARLNIFVLQVNED